MADDQNQHDHAQPVDEDELISDLEITDAEDIDSVAGGFLGLEHKRPGNRPRHRLPQGRRRPTRFLIYHPDGPQPDCCHQASLGSTQFGRRAIIYLRIGSRLASAGMDSRVGFNRVMGSVVLATMGSWGDIFVIGLAKGLTEAGHDVRVAASPAHDELVRAEGLEFSGIGPAWGFSDYARDPKILSGRLGGFVGFARLFRRFIFPALDRYVDDLAASIGGVDLLLAHPALIAAPVAAEHVGVRRGTISVFPGLIPTAYAPPAPTRVSLGSGPAGRAVQRAAWRAARFNMARLFDRPVNQARRRLGLRARV
jgi:hypothetical protein